MYLTCPSKSLELRRRWSKKRGCQISPSFGSCSRRWYHIRFFMDPMTLPICPESGCKILCQWSGKIVNAPTRKGWIFRSSRKHCINKLAFFSSLNQGISPKGDYRNKIPLVFFMPPLRNIRHCKINCGMCLLGINKCRKNVKVSPDTEIGATGWCSYLWSMKRNIMVCKGSTLNGDRGYQIFTMDFNRYL